MTILSFLVQLMSGATLLLFAVRYMRIGIERLWSPRIRASLNERSSTFHNLMKGLGLGFVMQGGTVVMLMAAGLAGAGAIPVASAAIVALGADTGSALAVQFLQLPVSAIGPLATLLGGSLYLRAAQPRLRNFGRVVLGLGLIFLSLSIIRASVAPIGNLPGAASVVDYLNRDPITAALMGVALTVVMHSSVAAILTAVAFTNHAALGPAAALGFVLGCNLGSALLPLWLLKYENDHSKVVALAVAILRSGAAIAFIVVLAIARGKVDAESGLAAGEMMLVGHLAFNFLLPALAPLCTRTANLLAARLARQPDPTKDSLPVGTTEDISLALPAIKRRLSSMLDIASTMLEEVTSDTPDKEAMAALERKMNAGLANIREIFARLPSGDEHGLSNVQQILEFAIKVERCGDVLSGKYMSLRLEQLHGDYHFTEEGKAEIAQIVDAVRRAIILAHETAWTGDVAAARRLVEHKQQVADMESDSRGKHLARLRRGNLTSLGSSNQHLEVIGALKEINSKFATIGYAVLEQHGGLKKSRLISVAGMSAQ